ncbi:MAG: DUF72 domain-containing protein [Bacteroidota bacterium]
MKFGKLPDVQGVDFSLPSDSPESSRFLAQLPAREGPAQVYVGCTGFSMKEWVGRVYPAGTKAKDFLRQYSLQFNTIEFNTTHYRIPTVDSIRKWREESSEDFRFCPKILQRISHSRDMALNNDLLPAFCDAIRGLDSKLGCCFVQLPPYFGRGHMAVLENFLQRWPKDLSLAVELRHESWFEDASAGEAAFQLLESHGIGAVITDVAGRRDVLHQRLCNKECMIRFVGNGLHPTDYERIDAWIERLGQWIEAGLERIYFFPHQPDNLLAPEMANYICQKLKTLPDVVFRGPKLLDEDAGKQISLF